jgi:hypothetical protein
MIFNFRQAQEISQMRAAAFFCCGPVLEISIERNPTKKRWESCSRISNSAKKTINRLREMRGVHAGKQLQVASAGQ